MNYGQPFSADICIFSLVWSKAKNAYGAKADEAFGRYLLNKGSAAASPDVGRGCCRRVVWI
ncbi:MAG: hypothetical protein E7679_05440 [Ruminococcaceae bacterium]|nr:hypothetical protein [Oscillospiraceae bacterium]